MEETELRIDKTQYKMILRQYGLEGAKKQAISMCLAANLPMTEHNLLSQLTILEQDLSEMFG